jgi:hypothetical protein
MLNGLIKGIKGISSSEYGREIGLAIVAGAVAWLVDRQLKKWDQEKNGSTY